MFANYTSWYLFLCSFGSLLQITTGNPVDPHLIDQNKHNHVPLTKVLKHKKRSLDHNIPTQRVIAWERNLGETAKVAGESSSAKEVKNSEYTFIEQTKRENLSVTKFPDPEGRPLNDAIPSQQLRLSRRSVGDTVEGSGESGNEENGQPLEYMFTDQSQRERLPVTKFLDQGTSSLSSISREKLRLWQRSFGDTAKFAGVSENAKDAGKRLRQHRRITKAQKHWRETHKHGCTATDESCVEITNEGTVTYSK
ncbi:hypothetical protein PTTG_26282 [Puccinia triticina 1-1 BBBD Race 1]|uniref:Uncharacterized protein n=2 Tax=Puccinia triticina TaxID=208348 RepID=A0A180GV24_PUCT1|nr:uncharacterized protein PtA15_1A791 [Puccinia triticina]OAV96625.1 hypothetical protein PTTG_26282 [Puccinia triticina 1-1 BBBD Race 1]WAQ81450.1 hypothetical protein PtA15_1A791 [Puccinia triticina]